MNRLYRLASASIIAITVAVDFKPSSAQLVVFDPNNYAQNVLTAARALQQINNQIVSLQNQAQMLINQARNLATLPFSSLLQLEQSILRTQQLLAQAQRIAYDIQQIDRAFSTTYAPASSSASDQALIANAQSRWQNAMSGFQDAMRTQATVVGNLEGMFPFLKTLFAPHAQKTLQSAGRTKEWTQSTAPARAVSAKSNRRRHELALDFKRPI
jgi:P-type conjugative transfer protein TrbJ